MSVEQHKRRLALLLPSFEGGGAERVSLELIRHWVATGHEVDLVLVRATGALLPLLPDSVMVIDLGAKRFRNALRPLIRYLRERRPAALHVAMWPLTLIGIIAHRMAGSRARLVLSDHTTLSIHYSYFGRVRRFLMSRSIRWLYPYAHARVAVSQESAVDLARLSRLKREWFEVIHNPVARPPDEAPEASAEQLWGDARWRIISVGRMSAEKNQELLIRAFARLQKVEPSSRLVLLGEGPLRTELEKLVRQEGLEGKVRMPGFAANPWPCYSAAHLFVLTSDLEGYPLVLIEAMRSGLSVVSTDCRSGPREILAGGEYGWLVPCGEVEAVAEAMTAALRNPIPPDLLRARAEMLSGEGTLRRHFELMLGEDQPSRVAKR